MIAQTPAPPYYAVIFTNVLSEPSKAYQEMAKLMENLVKDQDGYLGHESARDGLGITVSYWRDVEAINQWKHQSEHLLAQKLGREQWYQSFKTRICRVEREYGFGSENT
ncbi:antibiotic biosynthesis monooxygenase [Algoriphagus sp.]|uniref:antibiotic biosynthesis monooxygenase family protein n=1 Tax=Algoriphagus sp. TaxID=1872435 RepID=UPI002612C0E7|nr:antibiotic biosynthesis monooxygenase [Algoriphagus sp.]